MSLETAGVSTAGPMSKMVWAASPWASGVAARTSVFALPFDALRAHYANAVQAGLVERSMLASREFERTLASMEQWALGPFARRV